MSQIRPAVWLFILLTLAAALYQFYCAYHRI